jgi:hypothetical protein
MQVMENAPHIIIGENDPNPLVSDS